jgi:hypothetical protein
MRMVFFEAKTPWFAKGCTNAADSLKKFGDGIYIPNPMRVLTSSRAPRGNSPKRS